MGIAGSTAPYSRCRAFGRSRTRRCPESQGATSASRRHRVGVEGIGQWITKTPGSTRFARTNLLAADRNTRKINDVNARPETVPTGGGEKRGAKPKAKGKTTARGKTPTKLLVAMTGKASDAKTADGDEPVFDYIASLPQPQRGIAERIDALAARTLPGLERGVKWGMAYYGVDGGWCFASGGFVGHVKLMFIRGTEIKPEPPVTPIGMGKATRGVEPASVNDLDERQLASWMKQASAMPFFGGKKHGRRSQQSGG